MKTISKHPKKKRSWSSLVICNNTKLKFCKKVKIHHQKSLRLLVHTIWGLLTRAFKVQFAWVTTFPHKKLFFLSPWTHLTHKELPCSHIPYNIMLSISTWSPNQLSSLIQKCVHMSKSSSYHNVLSQVQETVCKVLLWKPIACVPKTFKWRFIPKKSTAYIKIKNLPL